MLPPQSSSIWARSLSCRAIFSTQSLSSSFRRLSSGTSVPASSSAVSGSSDTE